MQNNFINRYNLDNFEASFRNFLIIEQVSSATLKNYLSDFRHFCGWLSLYISANHVNTIDTNDKNTIFTFLTVELIEQYKEYLVTNNLPDKTINRRLSSMRKFCSFAINQGWIKENPAKKVTNINSLVHHPELTFCHPELVSGSKTKIRSRNEFGMTRQVQYDKNVSNSKNPCNDMLNEFKQNLLSQQSDVTGRDGMHSVSTNDVNLILNDVNEFFTFIN